MPTVAVVVPTLNSQNHLSNLLQTLRAQDRQPDEVILVEAGASRTARGCADEFARANPSVEVLLIQNPCGTIPAGLNLGIHAAQSDIIVRLDAHACPAADYVRRCLEVLSRSGADMVGGRWEIKPGGQGPVAEAIALAVGHPLGAGDACYRLGPDISAGEVDTVPYGCFRRELWRRLGGYNEALQTNEDYEFNWRVRNSGGRVYFDPAIRTVYPARRELGDLARQYFRYGWWKGQMLRSHPTSIRWRQLLPMLSLALLSVTLAMSTLSRLALGSLLALSGLYLALIGWASLWPMWRQKRRSPALWGALLLAFMTVHFAWSSGAWANLLTGGRWPAWPVPGALSPENE